MSLWRKAGLSYSGYVSVAGKTLRAALKEDLKTAQVLNRSKTEAKFTILENGVAKGDAKPITE